MKTFCLFLICFFASSHLLRGQVCTISVKLVDNSGVCNTDVKLFLIRTSDNDSTLWSKQDSLCEPVFEVELAPASYWFRVKTMDGFIVDKRIEIGGSTSYNLGELSVEPNAKELKDVTFTGVEKKFIVVDAEKTTITVEGNPVLEISSVYDAILKIPGILPYPGGGFAMSGQLASVYFEGIPSSIGGTDLDNLLKSLPATSVQKIELITNPGASYDATVTGAIIDIISQGRVTKWISGTVSLNTGFNRNVKVQPSLMLSGKGKKYTWQFQTGYGYYERDSRNTSERIYNYFDTATVFNSERRSFSDDQNIYLRPSFTYRFNQKSFLQVNLSTYLYTSSSKGYGLNETDSLSQGTEFSRKGLGDMFSGSMKYRLFLDTLKRKMEITLSYNFNDNRNNNLTIQNGDSKTYSLFQNGTVNNSAFGRADFEIPFPKWKSQVNLGAKFNYMDVLSRGKYALNDSSELTLDSDAFQSTLPFRYLESNLGLYTEWKQRIGKQFSLTAGLRMEDFGLKGQVFDSTIITREYLNFFPALHLLYRLDPMVITMNYTKRINMPYYGQFDPNLNGYYDNFTSSTGNSALAPNFGHRIGGKVTVFDYLELSVNYSMSKSVNLAEVTADSNSLSITQTMRTYSNMSTLSYYMAVPIPFGMFKHGLDFFNQDIDVDAISFMYVYADRDKTFIPGYNYVNGNKAFWSFGCYSQIILPYKIRLNVDYNYLAKGMFQIYESTKGIHEVEVVLSREFNDKKWRVSLSVQDLLNTSADYNRTTYLPLTMSSYDKNDTRVVWFKIAHSFGRYEKPSLDDGGIPSKGGE